VAVASVSDRAEFDLDGGRVVIDGVDVSTAIRTPAIDRGATAVARHPSVRHALVARQRQMGRGGGVVMEGRDIGTVVFPDADLKIYLDASPEERARRRASDPAHTGAGPVALSDVATALAERDRSDSTRAASPLAMAPDAIRIETTGIPIDAVVEQVLAMVESFVAEKNGRV
jgi:cytidylate kinase